MTTKTLELEERQFKDTEIGAIPHEWDLVSFGEAFDFLRTASFSREQLGSVGDVQYIHYGDVHTKWNHYVDLAKATIPTVDSSMAGRYTKIRKGDLVVVDASEDYVGLSKSIEVTGLSKKEAISGLHTFLLRDKASNFVDGFRGYITSSPLVKPSLDRYATGMKVFGVSKTNLKLVLIPRPPREEQEAIVTALREVEALIGSLEKLIAKKRAIKQGVMQELLTGKRRLPGFSGRWTAAAFGDLFSFCGGYTASRDQLSTKGGHCYLHYGDIHLSNKTAVDVKEEFAAIPKLDVALKKVPKRFLLKDGDIVFVDASEDIEGTSRHVVVVNPDGIPFISGLHTIIAKPYGNELTHEYRRYCFRTKAVKDQFCYYVVGTKVSGISKTSIAKIVIQYPSRPEQLAVSRVLADLEEEIVLHEEKLTKLRLIKQGMMQSLLTGKIRLTA